MNAKELFLDMLNPDSKPQHLIKQFEPFNFICLDPINMNMLGNTVPGTTNKSILGVTLTWPEGELGLLPVINDETKVIKDITHWSDYLKIPDLSKICDSGWEEVKEMAQNTKHDQLICCCSFHGIFECTHFLMGFQDALTNLHEHPSEMHELIDSICDLKLSALKMYNEKLNPDVFFLHDDWGEKTRLFMSPEIWRKFYKEPYHRLFDYIHSIGKIGIIHADSYLADIVEDMIEIGIDCWQGVLPENDICSLQKQINGRMILMGGIGAEIDKKDSSEESVRKYVRKALEMYAPGGHFIPSITYGGPGPFDNPLVAKWTDDEIDCFNNELTTKGNYFQSNSNTQVFTKEKDKFKDFIEDKSVDLKNTQCSKVDNSDEILNRIKNATIKGLRKKTSALVKEALEKDISVSDIMNLGFIAAMTKIGDDFSNGTAFIPELLLASKCMKDGIEILKPYMNNGQCEPIGKVILGTIKGDLHDIGKDLVKAMLEGRGFEVIDLGVDVDPESFVDKAIEHNANIIACSSLLSISMDLMENIVKSCCKKGIRDKVKILVGGAPVTQEFCDKIGADAYTSDAGQCAQKAEEFIKNNI